MPTSTLNQNAWQYPYDTYNKLYLENTTAGHRKFYEMTHTASGWMARWGKIGTSGQTMFYHENLWGDKLSEKIKKGYVLLTAESMGTASKGKGTPPPVVKPHKPDPDILVDGEVMSKIDRVLAFLDSKGKDNEYSLVEDIKQEYVMSGILTKEDMNKLNKFWVTNGGGRW